MIHCSAVSLPSSMIQSGLPLIHVAVTFTTEVQKEGAGDGTSKNYQMIQVVSNSCYLAQRIAVTTAIKYKNLFTILDCQSRNKEDSWLYTST